jgi:hypothetical protein
VFNLPTDSYPKLIALLGLAMASACAFEWRQLVVRYEEASTAASATTAEAEESLRQYRVAAKRASEVVQRASEVTLRALEEQAAGRTVQAEDQKALGRELGEQSKAQSRRTEVLKEAFAHKQVEQYRTAAVQGAAFDRLFGAESFVLMGGTIFGLVLFLIGSIDWVRGDKKRSTFRRVSRRRGDQR